ncbi:MAG: AlpA family phage regulatory protein [Desulfuromonadales bacterium]|nr:MAG: AlpA family phage regulatory protein [Desulfuromonadales bacterium]
MKILRWPKVEEKTGISRTTAWRLAREGKFPAARKLTGARAVGWSEEEIDEWMASRDVVRKK